MRQKNASRPAPSTKGRSCFYFVMVASCFDIFFKLRTIFKHKTMFQRLSKELAHLKCQKPPISTYSRLLVIILIFGVIINTFGAYASCQKSYQKMALFGDLIKLYVLICFIAVCAESAHLFFFSCAKQELIKKGIVALTIFLIGAFYLLIYYVLWIYCIGRSISYLALRSENQSSGRLRAGQPSYAPGTYGSFGDQGAATTQPSYQMVPDGNGLVSGGGGYGGYSGGGSGTKAGMASGLGVDGIDPQEGLFYSNKMIG